MMVPKPRWWMWVLAALLLPIAAAAVVAWRYLPDEQTLATTLAALAEQKLGVPVHIGAARWRWRPTPALEIENAATVQSPALRVGRLVVSPDWGALLSGNLRLSHLQLDDAQLPQVSLGKLKLDETPTEAEVDTSGPRALIGELRVRNLVWISRAGEALAFEGQAQFDAHWRPQEVDVARLGTRTPTRLRLRRQADEDRWRIEAQLGGGRIEGDIRLDTPANAPMQLNGQLASRDVELESALASLGGQSPLRGQVQAETTLVAQGKDISELVRSLSTRSDFRMAPAVLPRFDVERAVRSAGRDLQGQTVLERVQGRVDTQNTAQGMVVRLRGVSAQAGSLAARGDATLANQRVDARVTVDVAGLVGVPLDIRGPVASPSVSVRTSGLASGAVGTARELGSALGSHVDRLLRR